MQRYSPLFGCGTTPLFCKDLGRKDTGADLVAKTYNGDYWAIQCKYFAENNFLNY